MPIPADPATRAWIDAYSPGTQAPLPDAAGIDTSNILHAADIWWSVKGNWCRVAQRAIRAAGEAGRQ